VTEDARMAPQTVHSAIQAGVLRVDDAASDTAGHARISMSGTDSGWLPRCAHRATAGSKPSGAVQGEALLEVGR
jgi:hypothetical protein